MITAQQAREKSSSMTNHYIRDLIDKCDRLIEASANGCKTSCSISIEYIDWNARENAAEAAMKDLISRGFKVQRDKGSDCRNESWDSLNIRW